jgi:uncharacterized phage-like protein YoqJ
VAAATAGTRRAAPSRGLTWAATGHRPHRLGGYDGDVLDRYIAVAIQFLISFTPYRVFIGMALGWDTAMAYACIDQNVPFVAAIPFEGQEKSWPHKDQERYRMFLSMAAEKHIISPGGYNAGAMFVRNRWMVDRCQAVAAMWDGKSDGGTVHCIEYAQSKNVPVVNLWDPRLMSGFPMFL